MAFLYLRGMDYHGNGPGDFDRYDAVRRGGLSNSAEKWFSTGGKFGGAHYEESRSAFGRGFTREVIFTTPIAGGIVSWYVDRQDSSATLNGELAIQNGTAEFQMLVQWDHRNGAGTPYVVLDWDGTVLGTSSASATIWDHVELRFTLSGTVGVAQLYVNGTLEVDLSGISIGQNTFTWNSYKYNSPTGLLRFWLLDDIVFQDAAGDLLEEDHRIYAALPSGDVEQAWTRSAGADNYALVDDPDPDGDTTYVDSVNGRDVYSLTAPTITEGIRAVVIKALGRRPSGVETLQVGLIDGSANELLSSAIAYSSTTLWKEAAGIFETAPDGGPWTQAKLDDVDFILKATGTGIRVTQVWMEVLTAVLILPDQPTITTANVQATSVTLNGSAFAGAGPHQDTQWQVTTAFDAGFATPVFDETNAVDLETIDVTGLTKLTGYIARVRYRNDANNFGAWSTAVPFTTTEGPNKPTIVASDTGPDFVEMTGSAYVGDGDVHASSDWQLTLLADAGFASPILDESNRNAAELLVWTEFNLDLFNNQYLIRVRYVDSSGDVSDWSDAVTTGIVVTGQFYTPFGERALGFVLRSANWDEVWAALESTWTNTADPDAICEVVSRRLPNTPTAGEVDPIFWQGFPSVDKQIIWTRIKFDQVGLGVVPCVGDSSPNGIICRVTEGLENFEDFEDPLLPGWRVVKSGAGAWSQQTDKGASLAGDGAIDPVTGALRFRHVAGDTPNAMVIWDGAGVIAQGKWMQVRTFLDNRSSPGYWWLTAWPGIMMGAQDDTNYYSFQNVHQCNVFATWTFQITYKHGPLSTDFASQSMFRSIATPVGSTLSYHVGASKYDYIKGALTDDGAAFGQIEETYPAFGIRRGFDREHRFSTEGSWTSGKVGLVVNSCSSMPAWEPPGPLSVDVLFDQVAITTNNIVTFTGLPAGWYVDITADSIAAANWFGNETTPDTRATGNAAVDPQTVSFRGHAMPYDTLNLYDADGNLIETWTVGNNALGQPGIWGGDVYNISVGGGGIGAIGGPSARNTGTPGGTTGSGYYAYLSGGTELRLDRGDDVGGLVNLGTFPFVYEPKIFYNIVLEATGTTIRAKVWSGPESADPGIWHIDVVDGTYAIGAPGLVGLDGTAVDFDVFAAGIGGDPYPTGRNPGTPVWLTPTIPFTIDATRVIALSWTRPQMAAGVIGGDVTYELQYRRNIGEAWTDLTTTIDPVRSFAWDTTTLQANADYCVRVRTLVACEAGPWAEICSISVTEEAEEPCPEDNPDEGIPTTTGVCDGGAQVVPSECDGGIEGVPDKVINFPFPQDFETTCAGDSAIPVEPDSGESGIEPDSICP